MILTDAQYDFLRAEATLTGLSRAELVRRELDCTYRPETRQRVAGYELSVGLFREPDAAVAGRRLIARWRDRG